MVDAELKRQVLAAAQDRLLANLNELKDRIRDLHAVTIGDDNAESASQTESTHGSDVELLNSLGEQIEHLQQDLERLSEIDPAHSLKTIQYGAMVLTDKRNFIVGSSIEEFRVGDMPFLGVTPKAPLIQAMLGKKAGDEVVFNGISYHIKTVA